MIVKITDTSRVSSLFGKWEETFIWSCLQGVMGEIYADDSDNPTAAMAMLGDFAFFAGKPTIELIVNKPAGYPKKFIIMIPQNESWQNMITGFYGKKAKTVSRYAMKKGQGIFDKEKLQNAVASLPEGYTVSLIDEPLYQMCKAEAWSADLVSQFADYESYRNLGIGVVICKDNQIVSGASSYSRYNEGIEIEIDTKKEYRRRGLAYVCGAKLILECLRRGLYPSWDAQNTNSVALAEKLGYHYSHTYMAVEIWDY